MVDWLEARASELLMFVWPFLAFAWTAIIAPLLFPPDMANAVGAAGYFLIILGGLLGTDIAIREMVNKYPYLEVIVRPENKRLHLFIAGATARKRGENLYSAKLNLAFPVKFADYGKIKEVVLNFHGKWSERIHFRPGYCNYFGYRVKHPQTELIEVYQVRRASTELDHGEPIPVFFLHSASQDCLHPKIAVPASVIVNPKANPALSLEMLEEIEELKNENEELRKENVELRRKAEEWMQKALTYEEVVEQQKVSISGLLDAKTGIKEHALAMVLGLWQACGSFDQMLKQLGHGRFRFTFNKYMAIVILGALLILYLWFNPQIVSSFMYWLSQPIGAFIALIIAVVAISILWRKKGR